MAGRSDALTVGVAEGMENEGLTSGTAITLVLANFGITLFVSDLYGRMRFWNGYSQCPACRLFIRYKVKHFSFDYQVGL